jgi:hypothetical protein
MRIFSKTNKPQLVVAAALACVMLIGSVSAFAVPAAQVAVTTGVQSVTARCCVLINPMVRVTEPTTLTPVIVTWSADYNVSGTTEVALSVNGAPCNAGFGPMRKRKLRIQIGVMSAITVAGPTTSVYRELHEVRNA